MMDAEAILATIGGAWVIITSLFASIQFGYYMYRGVSDLQAKIEKVQRLEQEKVVGL